MVTYEMNQPPLSRMQSVPVREVWPHEASDFTPWLADHIDELGDALGISLKMEETESPVGGRYLDILAVDADSGRPVIIENQLDYSHGDHLSRLLIYAAGKDADVVIWVASEFEEEHWLVLQWLNQRTVTTTRFFGVAVEVWKIDDSSPAPYFRVVASPNDWRKRNIAAGSGPVPPGMRRKYQEFRLELEEKLRAASDLPLAPGNNHSNPWLSIIQGGGIRYSIDFRNRIYLSFQLDTRSGQSLEWCHAAFDLLARDQEDIIEPKLGQLEWTRHWQGRRGSRIASYYSANFIDALDSWDEVHAWTIETYRKFREVFEPYRDKLQTALSQSDEHQQPTPSDE